MRLFKTQETTVSLPERRTGAETQPVNPDRGIEENLHAKTKQKPNQHNPAKPKTAAKTRTKLCKTHQKHPQIYKNNSLCQKSSEAEIQNLYLPNTQVMRLSDRLSDKDRLAFRNMLTGFGYPQNQADNLWKWYAYTKRKGVASF